MIEQHMANMLYVKRTGLTGWLLGDKKVENASQVTPDGLIERKIVSVGHPPAYQLTIYALAGGSTPTSNNYRIRLKRRLTRLNPDEVERLGGGFAYVSNTGPKKPGVMHQIFARQ